MTMILTDTRMIERLPIKPAHMALEAYHNWSQYMQDLFAHKLDQVRNGEIVEGMDIMGTLVKTAYRPESEANDTLGKSITSKAVLSDSHIMGNAFVMILAGHETTANSLLVSLIELAINPEPQRQAQEEIRATYGDETPEKWNYDSTINKLLSGILGAILSEELRLMPPSLFIPKTVLEDQTIMIDGRQITFPAGAQLNLVASRVHRDPRYWPTQPSTVSKRPDDLDDFKPERWLVKHIVEGETSTKRGQVHFEEKDLAVIASEKSHSNLFRPVAGSYLPFSDGARSCLGRRLAQVEIMAILAVVFQHHSVELAVDQWASDDEVSAMSVDEKISLYGKAQEKARQAIRMATTVITLKLVDSVPIRVVRKGEERFIKYI